MSTLDRAAGAIRNLRPGDRSRHGRVGVWMGRALFRLLEPYSSRSRVVDEALLAAIEDVVAASVRTTEAVEALTAKLGRLDRRLDDVEQRVAATTVHIVPRVTRADAINASGTLVVPVRIPSARTPPPGCVRVATDVGDMWVIERDQMIGAALRSEHSWESWFNRLLERHVRPGMTVLDVGANIGYVSRVLARLVGAQGMVIAVEPEPDNFEVLCANVTDLEPEIHCLRAAAADANGEIALWLDEFNLGDHRAWGAGREHARQVRVPAVRMDDVIDGTVNIDVVKVDTQASDHVAIAGMVQTISRCRPTMFVEFWLEGIEAREENPSAILDFYRSLGFAVSVADAADRTFTSNEAVIEFTERSRGRFVDLLLQPL